MTIIEPDSDSESEESELEVVTLPTTPKVPKTGGNLGWSESDSDEEDETCEEDENCGCCDQDVCPDLTYYD